MAQFSIDIRELEVVNALNTLCEVTETQMLDTQAIMHELSTGTIKLYIGPTIHKTLELYNRYDVGMTYRKLVLFESYHRD